MNLIHVTTQGDAEGRTTQTIGYFFGSELQVAEYLLVNNLKPYYDFSFNTVKVHDVSGTHITYVDKIEHMQWGRVAIKTKAEKAHELRKQHMMQEIRNKLTPEEQKLLGL